jgi:hypothetical protein
MLRRRLMTSIIALTIAAVSGAQAQAADAPCILLTADDITAVLGGPLGGPNSDSTSCVYTSQATSWNGQNASATLMLAGGRAEYAQSVGFGAKYGTPYPTLTGVGDKAYENNSCGDQCSEVGVLKKNTFFMITVQEDPKHATSAVTLARKAAARVK